jgi:hypothetical protein
VDFEIMFRASKSFLLLLTIALIGIHAQFLSGQNLPETKSAAASVEAQAPQPPFPKIPQGISLAAGLSEDDAVAIALWNNAAFQADLAALGVARADLVEAGLLRNPTLQLLLPIGYKQSECAGSIRPGLAFRCRTFRGGRFVW